jgi:hypothetical protein
MVKGTTVLLGLLVFIFFLSGCDENPDAVEVKTGKTEWKLRSPDVAKNSGAFFGKW